MHETHRKSSGVHVFSAIGSASKRKRKTKGWFHLWSLDKLLPRRLHDDKVELHGVDGKLHAPGKVLQRSCQKRLLFRTEASRRRATIAERAPE